MQSQEKTPRGMHSPSLGCYNLEGASSARNIGFGTFGSPDLGLRSLDSALSVPRFSSSSCMGNIHEIIYIKHFKPWGNYTCCMLSQSYLKNTITSAV